MKLRRFIQLWESGRVRGDATDAHEVQRVGSVVRLPRAELLRRPGLSQDLARVTPVSQQIPDPDDAAVVERLALGGTQPAEGGVIEVYTTIDIRTGDELVLWRLPIAGAR